MSRPKLTAEQKAAAKAEREALAAPQANAVEQGNAPEPEPVAPPPEAPPPAVVAELPALADYIKSRERDGIVLVRVTYPGAEAHVFASKYSGVQVSDGPLSCLYADGSTE